MYFPSIDTSELDIAEFVKAHGYEQVMRHIWFCYLPLKGRPCGMCRPCQEKMESGMEFLLDEDGRRHYRLWAKHGNTLAFRIYRRLLHVIY